MVVCQWSNNRLFSNSIYCNIILKRYLYYGDKANWLGESTYAFNGNICYI